MPAIKRFYKKVSIASVSDGWVIKLDSRLLSSPAGMQITLPTANLANAIAKEWRRQDEYINPSQMPLFGLAATAVDRVMSREEVILKELVDYGGNDLLCYRAGDPELANLQQEHWQPWIEWVNKRHNIELLVIQGIMPIQQPDIIKFQGLLEILDFWRLGLLHRAVTISGSLVLGLAFLDGCLKAKQLFKTAFLDELWQNKRWGCDCESVDRQNEILLDLQAASIFLKLLPLKIRFND